MLSRRTLGQALSLPLHSLTVDRSQRRKSLTVIEAIAVSAKPVQLNPDRLKTDTHPLHKDTQYNLGDFFTVLGRGERSCPIQASASQY